MLLQRNPLSISLLRWPSIIAATLTLQVLFGAEEQGRLVPVITMKLGPSKQLSFSSENTE